MVVAIIDHFHFSTVSESSLNMDSSNEGGGKEERGKEERENGERDGEETIIIKSTPDIIHKTIITHILPGLESILTLQVNFGYHDNMLLLLH